MILVGAYRNDQQTSVWRYRAELLTPEALLYDDASSGTNWVVPCCSLVR